MAKLGTLTLKGKSGNSYNFNVYSKDAEWADEVECVYYVSKRTKKSDGTGDHSEIYIGETEDIKIRFSDHHKQECFDGYQYNAISVHRVEGKKNRKAIEKDLIDAIDPPCNG